MNQKMAQSSHHHNWQALFSLCILIFAITILSFGQAWAADPSLTPRQIAGHALRRMAFGATQEELDRVERIGLVGYVQEQTNPSGIDDRKCQNRLKAFKRPRDDWSWYQQQWYLGMLCTKRQFLERMTLFWHEHFATSFNKAGLHPARLRTQEFTLRRHALGNFRDMLKAITIDPAMLIWLDGNMSNGSPGHTPNENYAREFMQLFTLGTHELNMDGTQNLDGEGQPVPAYTERDVREAARALSGWVVVYEPPDYVKVHVKFDPALHDAGNKTVLGKPIRGRKGKQGAREVDALIEILMSRDTMAPFIAKTMIQKFATQKPSGDYVSRVATVFRNSGGSIRKTIRAVLLDPEFLAPATVLSQPVTPVELFMKEIIGLRGVSKGLYLLWSLHSTGHQIYEPPSVFSFYPPGQKERLLGTDRVMARDNFGIALTEWWSKRNNNETYVDTAALKKKYKLSTPLRVIRFLEDLYLQQPLESRTRKRILDFMDGKVDEWKLKQAIRLFFATPDFQRN